MTKAAIPATGAAGGTQQQSPHAPAHTPLRVTAAASRMRIYRERARNGAMVATVEILPDEVAALVHRGLLAPAHRGSRVAIGQAIEWLLERVLAPSVKL